MSNNILVWDWKYKIFFDETIQSQVDRFIACLQGEERNIYNKIKNYFLSFYSISILIDAIKSDPQKASDLIGYALATREHVIKTPKLLHQLLMDDISDLDITAAGKSDLSNLLEFSVNYGCEMNYLDICETLFGDWFPLMIEEVMKVTELQKVDHGVKLSVQDVSQLYQNFYKQLLESHCLKDKFGSCAIGSYETRIENGVGFAEWWDRELLDSKEDLLILYTNADSLNSNDLYYTIIHEMYPGHGHFYNSVTHSGHLVDHGAMSIIEGWATYVEWNSIESTYAENCRNNALFFLRENAINDVNERAVRAYQRKIKQGYSETEALRTTRYATQYLGFLEAYYYGAIWIELFMNKKGVSPHEFITFLSNQNVGDFFATWAKQ
ncbi:MAG: M1 family metallopeptidase [Ruminococcaceae bacterium]|nr:M1 family metallopeptidase [Oscillospiraceae bacterium]